MIVHTFRTWIPWVAAALAIPIAAAQGRGTSGTGGTGTPNTGTTRSTTTSPTTTGNTSTTTTPSPTTPIFLSGRVQMEDGTPPPEGVRIERVCGGSIHTEGFTDTNGNFGIQIGSVENAAYQDASDTGSDGLRSMGGTGGGNSGGFNNGLGGGVTDRRLTNCDLRARLGGYRSQSISLTGRRPMDNPDVGVILLHKDSGEGATTVAASSLAAPKDARKAFDKAQDLMQKGKVNDAYKNYQKAVSLYRGYAAAWCEMGRIEAGSGQFDKAVLSFREAVKADAKYADGYVQLGALAVRDKNWQEAADLTGQALKLNSFDYPLAWFDNAVANYNLNHMEEAEKSAVKTERLDTRHRYPQAEYLEGLIQINRRDYKAAAESIRGYLKRAPDAADATQARDQLAKIEALATAEPGK
ncbi:MAG: tetratricopeptide repeat protein [Bryobacteraceae bacterium]